MNDTHRASRSRTPIAIVGAACRFPGAPSLAAYWTLLAEGRDAIADIPPERWDAESLSSDVPEAGKMVGRQGGFLRDLLRFDAGFFGIGDREAEAMDPQHRQLLEVSFEALEASGLAYDGQSGGVFVGLTNHDSLVLQGHGATGDNAYVATGSSPSVAAGRISYTFGLSGPSLAVDTACSSSLVAIHLACAAIANDECTFAIAGGANAILSPTTSVLFSHAGALSRGGRCRTFDAKADGYVRSEGVGMVVLKALDQAIADGDSVLGVVLGSAVNHGGRTNKLTAPSLRAETAVIVEAFRRAGLAPRDAQLFEAHGTGTLLGDAIEVAALARAIGAPLPGRRYALGAVKANIGHTESAAGVAGLLKALLAIRHREVPATLHYETPNPHLGIASTPLRVQEARGAWPSPDARLVAGVSAFGFSGTNAHVVVGEAEAEPAARWTEADALPPASIPRVVPVSGKDVDAVRRNAANLADFFVTGLTAPATFRDAVYTACCRRTHHALRAAVVAENAEEAVRGLRAVASGEHGAQGDPDELSSGAVLVLGEPSEAVARLAIGLLDVAEFRDMVETLETFRGPSHVTPWRELLRTSDWVARADVAPFLTFATQVGAAALLAAAGVTAPVVLGWGAGEIAALHLGGALSLEQAARRIVETGRQTPSDEALATLESSRARLAREGLAPVVRELLEEGFTDFLELAAGSSEVTTALADTGARAHRFAPDTSPLREAAALAAALYERGGPVGLGGAFAVRGRMVDLPAYAWQGKRHVAAALSARSASPPVVAPAAARSAGALDAPSVPDLVPPASAASAAGGGEAWLAELLALSSAARAARLEHYLAATLASVARLPIERIATSRPMLELGIDSLVLVRLQNTIQRDLGITLAAAAVLEFPTIQKLAAFVSDEVDRKRQADIESLLLEIEELSEEEAVARLAELTGR